MIRRHALGVDPGPTCGVALLELGGQPLVFQANAVAAWGLVAWLAGDSWDYPVHAGIEAFAPGHGAGARGPEAAVTRGLIAELTGGSGALSRVAWHARTAAAVKPWATDKRLAAAKLSGVTAGMPHARDAVRHALFCGVHDLGWPDPLSRAWKDAARIDAAEWSRADVAESFREWLGPAVSGDSGEQGESEP